MNRTKLSLSTALFAATLVAIPVYGADNSSQSSSPSSSPAGQSGSSAGHSDSQAASSSAGQQNQRGKQDGPDGWVLVEDRVVYLFANEPQQHLMHARTLLDQKNNKAAASEIRIAAGYLDMQGSRKGDQQASQRIRQAGKQLDQFADQVEQDKNVDVKQLDKTFAQAYVALADFHRQMAAQELNDQKGLRAGHDLNAASMSLQQALAASDGMQADQQVQKAVADCSQVASQLLNPASPGQQQQETQQQASASGGSASSGSSPQSQADQAQQAGYQSGQDLNQTSQSIPQNAQQACEELSKAIQSLQSKLGGSSSGASGSRASHSG